MENWRGVADAYRRSFATLCAGTFPTILADLELGRLLDIGCGTGDLLVEAGRRGFDVTGADADVAMVRTARTMARCPVVTASLPHLPFPDDAFDSIVANFVINHVPDPRAALDELKRVVAPGGLVAVSIWPAGGSAWSQLVNDSFLGAGVSSRPSTQLPEELDFPRTPEGLSGITVAAGFHIVSARDLRWAWQITPNDLWAGISGGIANAGMTYRAQPPRTQQRVRQEFTTRATQLAGDDDLLHIDTNAVYVLARG
ncbi:class I SAM-dependent methyltransferase [Flexivirga caeni]|uniref:class I SAM-dependent methyltransferase n=1 Tax=Flexivirga caeni TaxID=2294115 RepID=UPI00131593E4|nr:class I SAM-dependent methyltransferase [Flexivirga caeni]